MEKNQKQSFGLGLAIGIAAVSLIGFVIMGVAYVQKGNNTNTADSDKEAAAAYKNEPTTPPPAPDPAPEVDLKKLEVRNSEYIRGKKDAPVTVITYSDYQCPFCSRFHDTMKQVIADYPNKVRWVYRSFPLSSLHPYAQKAAEAAECAGEQNKFWEYTDEIFANQASLNNDYLTTAAKNIKLNTTKFESCLNDGKYVAKVKSDFSEGQSLGVNGTPGSFINGQSVKGALPYENIKAIIDSL